MKLNLKLLTGLRGDNSGLTTIPGLVIETYQLLIGLLGDNSDLIATPGLVSDTCWSVFVVTVQAW